MKAEFQRQIDAVPRFEAGGPETITLKAGSSSARIQNTTRRVAEYMKALDTVKGGKTPKPVSAKTDLKGSEWLGGTGKRADITVINDMIDDMDPQAAVDYAAAQGIDLEEALKDDKRRLSHILGRKPTPETPNAAEAAPATPAPRAGTLPPDKVGGAIGSAMRAARGLWDSSGQRKQDTAFLRELRLAGVKPVLAERVLAHAKTVHADRMRGSSTITYLSAADLHAGLERHGLAGPRLTTHD